MEPMYSTTRILRLARRRTFRSFREALRACKDDDEDEEEEETGMEMNSFDARITAAHLDGGKLLKMAEN